MSDIIGMFFYLLAIIAFIILIPMTIIHSIDRNKWLYEHCVVMGKISGDIGIGFSTNGQAVVTSSSQKIGYKCDDGKQYWE